MKERNFFSHQTQHSFLHHVPIHAQSIHLRTVNVRDEFDSRKVQNSLAKACAFIDRVRIDSNK